MARLTSRLSYANVMATVAVFIALGGVSYAAIALPINSVGSKQIKRDAVKNADLGKSAVTTGKVKNGSLLSIDFKPGQLFAGAPGATGPQGPQGLKGDKGEAGPLLATLPSGKTLVGKYYVLDFANGVGDVANDTISYQFPLAAPPVPNYLSPGAAPTANCPGSSQDPRAAPGNLCVYSTTRANTDISNFNGLERDQVDRFGAALKAKSSVASGGFLDTGNWAVTAP